VLFALADLSRLRGKDDEAEGKLQLLLRRPVKDREELANIKIMLADIYSRKKLYEKAIPLYAEAFNDKGDMVAGAALDYLAYANALREKDLFAPAVTNYQLALKEYNRNQQRYSPAVAADAYLGSGDVLYREKKYREGLAMYEQSLAVARGENNKSWALYHAGQGYTKLGNVPMAEKTFSQLKESGKEGFWDKVSDYWRNDNAWLEKNTRYLK
jgi:tetratricopeptide (TPR) repeat protein